MIGAYGDRANIRIFVEENSEGVVSLIATSQGSKRLTKLLVGIDEFSVVRNGLLELQDRIVEFALLG